MKHELKVGMKIRFSGPIYFGDTSAFYQNSIAIISSIEHKTIGLKCEKGLIIGFIHRGQIESVFVKKPKLKLFKFIFTDETFSFLELNTIEQAKNYYKPEYVKEVIEFKELRRHKVKD